MDNIVSKGTLLIASPHIHKGLYAKSVILICEHNRSGSFGLILNKPLEVELPEDILDLEQSANPHITTWVGGPIQIGQMMLLHTSPSIPEQVLSICPNIYLGGDLDFLQKSASNPQGPLIRLCFGYSGWISGQLDKELVDKLWITHPAQEQHLFGIPSEKLWSSLLCDLGHVDVDKDLLLPADPSQN